MRRVAAGGGIILVMVSLVLIFILAVIIYRTLAAIWLFNNAGTKAQTENIKSLPTKSNQ